MRQRSYVAIFVVILLAACAGGFFGARYLLRRVQQDFTPRASWSPATNTPLAVTEITTESPETQGTLRPTQSASRPTATLLQVPSPATQPSPTQGSPAAPTASAQEPTFGPEPAPTSTAPPTQSPALPFVLARPVRDSTGDCPGQYVLGQVVDRAGSPLPGVRLQLVDEFNNAASAVTKSGQGDLGRYDFPLSGPARRFYLTVVDEGGQPLSPRVEIAHGLAPNADASCHWADWVRR